jgi:hypothetical protein
MEKFSGGNLVKEFEVTFYLANHEIGHLIKGKSEKEVSKYVARKLLEKKIWIIDRDIGICTSHVQYFTVRELD